MSAKDIIAMSGQTVATTPADDCVPCRGDLARFATCCQGPSATEKCLTLADKAVAVVGLIQRKTCCCDKCKACGKCCLPDVITEAILKKFHDTICTDRLERLGTYATDFGDTKIQKRGDNSVYIRSVRVRGEFFSVAYKLTLAEAPPLSSTKAPPLPSMEVGRGVRPRLVPNVVDPRMLRQKSQG